MIVKQSLSTVSVTMVLLSLLTVSGTDEAFFKVNSDGVLQVKSRVDRESLGASTLTFTLAVTDPGGQTTSSDLNITVTDINDNIPSCDADVYFIHVEEAGTGSRFYARRITIYFCSLI